MQGSKCELRPGVWELRVPTGKRRAPTDAAKAKAAELGRKAYGTSTRPRSTARAGRLIPSCAGCAKR